MYRALLGVSKVFVLIEKAMYRTLLVGVWLSGNETKSDIQQVRTPGNALGHTPSATCSTLPSHRVC